MREKKGNMSVSRALFWGKLLLVIFPLAAVVLFSWVSIKLSSGEIIPKWGIAIGIILGITFGWLLWSFLSPKWRVWAFSKVRNVHELRTRAIEEKLIWSDTSRFNKTEIWTKKQQKKWLLLESRFEIPDVFFEDKSTPAELVIKYGKEKTIQIVCFVLFAAFGLFNMFFIDQLIFAFLSFVLASIALFDLNRKPETKKIIINSEGIMLDNYLFMGWDEISEEMVVKDGIGSDSQSYLMLFSDRHGEKKIDITKFKINPRKLDKALKTYRIRYNKSINPQSQSN